MIRRVINRSSHFPTLHKLAWKISQKDLWEFVMILFQTQTINYKFKTLEIGITFGIIV